MILKAMGCDQKRNTAVVRTRRRCEAANSGAGFEPPTSGLWAKRADFPEVRLIHNLQKQQKTIFTFNLKNKDSENFYTKIRIYKMFANFSIL